MLSKIYNWFAYLYKLRTLFDSYLPVIEAHGKALSEALETIERLRAELEQLREERKQDRQSLVEMSSIIDPDQYLMLGEMIDRSYDDTGLN